ncbi:MAG: hypothetical protein QMB04_01945, partial [Pseudomonadales bacterium]
MQQNRNALLRDQALQAGNDILDRMRANSLTTYATVALDAEPATASDCNNVLCSRLVMKDFDIAQWKCRINPMTAAGVVHDTCDTLGIQTASLPGGRGSIGVDAADANIIIVDRFHKPGGHWNVAYPFVTLHQPSSFYGVSSRELSKG